MNIFCDIRRDSARLQARVSHGCHQRRVGMVVSLSVSVGDADTPVVRDAWLMRGQTSK